MVPDIPPKPEVKVIVSAAEKETQTSSREGRIAILFIICFLLSGEGETPFILTLNVAETKGRGNSERSILLIARVVEAL